MVNYTLTNPYSIITVSLLNKYQSSVLSFQDVAAELKVDVSDVECLVDSGAITVRTIGEKKRVLLSSLCDYINVGTTSKNNSQPVPRKNNHLITDILDIVLENKKSSCKKLSSYKWYCSLATHIRVYFKDVYIEDLNKTQIKDFSRQLSINYSFHLVKITNQLLKAVINISLENKYISVNPYDFIKKYNTGKKPQSRLKFLSDKQIKRLVLALDHSPTYKPLIIVLLHTGMRIGEALALKWSNVNDHMIYVENALSLEYDEDEDGNLINKRYVIGDTKTVCSVRYIPIDDEVINVLKEWKAYINHNPSLLSQIKINHNEDYVFVNQYGKLRSYQALRKGFKRFLISHGIKDNITFHMFRHTYATLLQEQGVDINIIKELLGHTDIKTTANIYTMVKDEPKREAVDKLSLKLKFIR